MIWKQKQTHCFYEQSIRSTDWKLSELFSSTLYSLLQNLNICYCMHKNFATEPYPELVNTSQPVSLNRLQLFGARINSRCNFQNAEIEITWFKFLVKTLCAPPPPSKQSEKKKESKRERKKQKEKIPTGLYKND